MLKLLARQGRTIICTIHQPTASHFQLFDQVYVLAKGQCVFQGASQQLVPFMSSVGLHCPKHYNPADYGKYKILYEYYVGHHQLLWLSLTQTTVWKLDPFPSPNMLGKNHTQFGPLERAGLSHQPEVIKHHSLK